MKWYRLLNDFIKKIDSWNFWWLGVLLLIVTFLPYAILQEGSIFVIHDQLDESMMNYVLTARHMGEDTVPEILGGINASGMQPSALLFVPLYRILPPLWAFVLQYGISFFFAFVGMHLLVRALTGSNILATAMAGCFCMLPLYPLYGLSIYGIPLVLYAFLCLWHRQHKAISFVIIAFFAATSHLVCTGYVVLGLMGLWMLYSILRRQWVWSYVVGILELGVLYVVMNYRLFLELLLGGGDYVSHRAELVNAATSFTDNVKTIFLHSAQHADSLHQYLILPILVMLFGYLLARQLQKKQRDQQEERCFRMAMVGAAFLVGTALFYGICKSEPVANWKNSMEGFLHYFQAERFYWLYPAAWYLEFALVTAIWWHRLKHELLKLALLVLILLPTLNLIKVNSFFYMNVNQINNGSGITGYVSWGSYYAEELMQQLDDAIGREKSDYRIAHLGINPAPALMHGFYTVDGYSNNYPLEYKHRFRQVIARELDKNEETKAYFDTWGSRCYLFNSATGTYWNLKGDSNVVYQGLEFDMQALKDLDCQYLFSGAEIADHDSMNLTFLGHYQTTTSYWGIWLYELE